MSFRKIVGLVSVMAIGSISIYGMGCSSSTSGGNENETDSGTGTKDTGASSTKDTGTSSGGDTGTSSGGDTGGGTSDAGPPPACYAAAAFMAFTWAPPTALHQGACTAAQLMTYEAALQSTSTTTFTSGSTTCDACLQTDVGAAAHGPILTATSMGMTVPQEINFGGCIANLDGNKAAGGCGNTVNNENDCIDTECAMCSDFQDMTQPITDSCVQAAYASGGACAAAANTPTMACQTELMGTADMACLTVSTLLSTWCGGATDGGTPSDGGSEQ